MKAERDIGRGQPIAGQVPATVAQSVVDEAETFLVCTDAFLRSDGSMFRVPSA